MSHQAAVPTLASLPQVRSPKANELQVEGKFDRSVSMLAWAYNEESNVAEFVERAMRLLGETCEDYELVLIDDASSDRTFEIASALQEQYPQLRILRNSRNRDCGWNIRIAVQAAQKEFLFWQTVDWSYDISQLRTYLELLKYYDVVQGVRVMDREPDYSFLWRSLGLFRGLTVSQRSDNLFKTVVSLTNRSLIRALFKLPVRDYQNVTFYPSALIQSIALEGISPFVNPECLLKTYWKGVRIKEVPIGFLKREKGEAKGTRPKALIAAFHDIVRLWFDWYVRGTLQRNEGVLFPFESNEWKSIVGGTPTGHGTLTTEGNA